MDSDGQFSETFKMHVAYPEMALLRFGVDDGDYGGRPDQSFIGQAVLPVESCRTGACVSALASAYCVCVQATAVYNCATHTASRSSCPRFW
jgi:hypothetical protein